MVLTVYHTDYYVKYSIWVVDNASTDGTQETIATEFPQVNLIQNDENVGFGRANNQGIEEALDAGARHLLLLNPDTVVRAAGDASFIPGSPAKPEANVAITISSINVLFMIVIIIMPKSKIIV